VKRCSQNWLLASYFNGVTDGFGKIAFLEIGCDIHQPDHYRNFDQRPDHSREGCARVDPENRYGDCNRQFEIVECRGEGQGRGLGIVRPSRRPM